MCEYTWSWSLSLISNVFLSLEWMCFDTQILRSLSMMFRSSMAACLTGLVVSTPTLPAL